MKEGWAVDSYSYPRHIAYPFCVKDDGTAMSEKENERFRGRYDIMSHNDNHNWGEKPVSHIKVVAYSLDPGQVAKIGWPCTIVYTTWGYGPWYWTHHVDTFVNGFHERVYKHLYSTPRVTDCWYDITYTQCELSDDGCVRYFGGRAYCSPSYGREYGRDPAGFDPGPATRWVKKSGAYGFTRCDLTYEAAMRYYRMLEPNHRPDGGEFSEVYRNAMSSIGADVNSLANVADFIGAVRDIKKGRLFKGISSISDTVKMAAKGWLGYRYAYCTTKSDLEEYQKLVHKFTHEDRTKVQIARAGLTNDAGSFHCKVVYSDNVCNKIDELYHQLCRAGLMVDEYKLWDMIPMSFVVDWFVPIGDLLEDISTHHWTAEYGMFNISTVTTSFKWTDSLLTNAGRVDVTYYNRSVTTEPPPFASYREDPSTSTVIKRWVDGGALLIG